MDGLLNPRFVEIEGRWGSIVNKLSRLNSGGRPRDFVTGIDAAVLFFPAPLSLEYASPELVANTLHRLQGMDSQQL